MQGQDNQIRRMFSYASRAMDSVEIADYCSMMGWTSDPVIAVLVDLLLEADESSKIEKKDEPDDLENTFEKGWLRGMVSSREMAEKSWNELKDCNHCNASDLFQTLVEDIEAAECPSFDDDENKPETELMTPTAKRGKTVNPTPKSKGSPGPEPTILLAIKSVLGRSQAPIKSADLVQAVLKESTSALKEGSIRNAITKAVEEQDVRKIGRGLYGLPNSKFS
ncbi:hypothetical protein [Polaromonas glacialis]|uniref:hypothetical protein n=1 Tax=Polaromonas glacialis TaxID=866564 RepID=UPI0004985762|nr:hypothetical protein [Polaromonas glacialis]